MSSSPITQETTTAAVSGRDGYVDFIRAFSLLVVVAWHWVFTIIVWEDDGPHATNPIGFTTGLWLATWLLQVMPLFFYVGGFSHLKAWEKASARGERIWHFTWRRIKGLAIPGLALALTWVALGAALQGIYGWEWIGRAVTLVVSPLWFLAVYLMLIALLPVALWLHARADTVVLVVLAGAAGAVDIVRFRYDVPWLGLVNMVLVWGLCHQLGFFYERIVAARRSVDWTLLLAGLFALAGLVGSGLYPGSMVGVPGERSNMAPPTLCIIALVMFQAGVVEVVRPTLQRKLAEPRWERASATINRFSLPLFLFHSTGMAVYLAVRYLASGSNNETSDPTAGWWLTRPLAVIGPLLFTMPVIFLFGRQWIKGGRGDGEQPRANPAPAA
ncbi:MAG: acyltransferase [Acidimicrobiia bacterium]|nr:acyltransferase [Acidimicrobiia bacterium]